jgi:hypothetical protein
VLNDNSIEHFTTILKNKAPGNLELLRISHCNVSWDVTYKILEQIKANGRNLRKLELIKANFNERSIELLGNIVKTSRSITYLDISWNDIPAYQMQRLLEVLSKNRRIQYLNLSWNSIIHETYGGPRVLQAT